MAAGAYQKTVAPVSEGNAMMRCAAAVNLQEPGGSARRARTAYSTTTRSVPLRPKVSGWYISSALAGGTTKLPGVVARAMYA